MKRLTSIAAAFAIMGLVALPLGGCAVLDTISTATKSIDNPVTRTDLYNLENAMIVAFAGLETYRRSCLAGAADSNCRENIKNIQFYTRQIPPILKSLRAFVKNNDQVNAVIAYRAVQDLITSFKAAAAANNVEVK